MAIDEAIMQLHSQGKAPPTLRCYGWEPPALSVGYFQSVRRDIDLERCAQAGITVVRRPTGGRAILHDHELTYSVVTSQEDPLVAGGIRESYSRIAASIASGLAILGIESKEGTVEKGPRTRSPACFDAAMPHELVVGGRKLVGSAQVRRGGNVLQHGSILLEINAEKLFSLFKYRSEDARRHAWQAFARRVVGLGELMGTTPSLATAAQVMQQGFQQALGVEFEAGELSSEERALAQRVAGEKYASAAWNLWR